MTDGSPARRVDILVCTFNRPQITATLDSLDAQKRPPATELRIIVADNAETPASQSLIEEHARTLATPVRYVHAPARNISIARNACLDAATGDWVALIDDDEIADGDWIAALLRRADETGADAVFGPALAEYGPEAPEWMRQQAHHSNIPERRDGVVETGHTCNALVRFGDVPWADERFDLARGRSGGEDTEFFFRLMRHGARFEIADEAIVREPVAPDRLRLGWLMQRKYRMGQSYAASAPGLAARVKLALTAAAKTAYCGVAACGRAAATDRRNFWTLRMALHAGVVSGCLALPQAELYGHRND
ncbi:succinoglycan biosynthesis protein ExoM [Tranquillimonas rosea]|uniref:Succinoglycan biosynthesis protein ExoM n=1 Tax=Tranquillimonas rosea TaxID=641238 RepID=A0A1H9WTK0_9RHOB|nr:glycosyltransferase family 2 protein [Tranquillimonas rosea]SES37017.1 succinoglycan biosynthesis protein ExoM [Tranquillimonas rosea]